MDQTRLRSFFMIVQTLPSLDKSSITRQQASSQRDKYTLSDATNNDYCRVSLARRLYNRSPVIQHED